MVLTTATHHPTGGRRRPWCPALVAVLVAAIAVAMTACGGESTPTGSGLSVVAAENVWGDIVRQIGGDRVTVTSLVTDPNADPHSFEAGAAAAAAIAHARLVVVNGAGYDTFVASLLAAGGSPALSQTVLAIDATVGATGPNVNPHLWYNPAYVTAGARAIAADLSKLDGNHAALFSTNLTTFLASYTVYQATIALIKQRHAGTSVAYTERVPEYLISAAGLTVASPANFARAIEAGSEPSPADAAAMNSVLTQRAVRALLYNSQVTSPVTQAVKDLAARQHIPVIGMAETIPAGTGDFETWQNNQAKALLAALGG